MGDEALRRFLEKVVLDDSFCELAASDPDRAFEGFDLSDRHKEALRRRDHGLLVLLGEALLGAPPPPTPDTPSTVPPEPPGPLPDLDEARVVVRLLPQAHWDEAGALKLTYAASLHPWPPQPAEPGTLSFLLRVTPRAALARDGQLKVSYAASIQPAPGSGADLPPPVLGATPTAASGPSVDSPEATRAAAAVRAAPPADRYQRLMELIEVLQR